MIPAFHDYSLEAKITKCGNLLYQSLRKATRGHFITTWTRWGGRGSNNVCFCPHSGYKNCPSRGQVKKWQNSVKVVVEWLLIKNHFIFAHLHRSRKSVLHCQLFLFFAYFPIKWNMYEFTQKLESLVSILTMVKITLLKCLLLFFQTKTVAKRWFLGMYSSTQNTLSL